MVPTPAHGMGGFDPCALREGSTAVILPKFASRKLRKNGSSGKSCSGLVGNAAKFWGSLPVHVMVRYFLLCTRCH